MEFFVLQNHEHHDRNQEHEQYDQRCREHAHGKRLVVHEGMRTWHVIGRSRKTGEILRFHHRHKEVGKVGHQHVSRRVDAQYGLSPLLLDIVRDELPGQRGHDLDDARVPGPDRGLEPGQIVPVDRAEIIQAQLAEHIIRQEAGFEPLLDLVIEAVKRGKTGKDLAVEFFEADITGPGAHGLQEARRAAHVRGDDLRHQERDRIQFQRLADAERHRSDEQYSCYIIQER